MNWQQSACITQPTELSLTLLILSQEEKTRSHLKTLFVQMHLVVQNPPALQNNSACFKLLCPERFHFILCHDVNWIRNRRVLLVDKTFLCPNPVKYDHKPEERIHSEYGWVLKFLNLKAYLLRDCKMSVYVQVYDWRQEPPCYRISSS